MDRPPTRKPSEPLNHIKPQSSLPQVGYVRGINIFHRHNQSLTIESLTSLVYPGFPATLNPITRWRLQ